MSFTVATCFLCFFQTALANDDCLDIIQNPTVLNDSKAFYKKYRRSTTSEYPTLLQCLYDNGVPAGILAKQRQKPRRIAFTESSPVNFPYYPKVKVKHFETSSQSFKLILGGKLYCQLGEQLHIPGYPTASYGQMLPIDSKPLIELISKRKRRRLKRKYKKIFLNLTIIRFFIWHHPYKNSNGLYLVMFHIHACIYLTFHCARKTLIYLMRQQ